MRALTLCVLGVLFVAASAHAQLEKDPAYGLSPDFRAWLTAHGYADQKFERADLPGGSYGGRETKKQKVVNQPVIFINGNSDRAVGVAAPFTGWRASIEYFQSQGYTSAELYATTWGPADMALAAEQVHSLAYLQHVRKFIEAVKKYTGAQKVDIVAHSMGVTLARKAIQGGDGLGPPLTNSIDTFVGIAGANRGLAACFMAPTATTCNDKDGFFPGTQKDGVVTGLSKFLADLNTTSHYEGAHVYSIWSKADTLIGFGTIVYGESTCRIPGQDGEKVFDTAPYGHIGLKDLTAAEQWAMVSRGGQLAVGSRRSTVRHTLVSS